ncbi:MAG: hypothetical protein JXR19_00640 [Bacteroidia bacterium]
MIKKGLKDIQFRWSIQDQFAMLLGRLRRLEKKNLKQYYLSNPYSEYFLVCSMGGVASSAMYQVFNTYSPWLINPVVNCSLNKRLTDAKLKHLVRPLDTYTLGEFPQVFQNDLQSSHVDVSKIKGAIYIIGDPALTVVSLYNRGLATDFVLDISQDKNAKVPRDISEFLDEGADVFLLEQQLDLWLKGSWQYDVLIVKYEHIWNHLDELAKFANLSPELVKKEFKQKKRRTKKDELYKKVSNRVYSSLQEKIEQLPPIQIIKRNA